jgi:hypothetical protein
MEERLLEQYRAGASIHHAGNPPTEAANCASRFRRTSTARQSYSVRQ